MSKFRAILIAILLLKTAHASSHIPQITTNLNGVSYYKESKFKKDEITKSFYYIRHGQTDVNKYGIVPENSDVQLNKDGIVQVIKAAKLLRDKDIRIIVASPFIRARQTAEIINKELNVPIVYHDGLKEADRGVVKGESIKNSKNKELWSRGEEIHGVENLYHFETRVHNTIKEIVNKYDNVLIVGHGVYFGNLTILLNEKYIKVKNATPIHFIPISGNIDKELYQIIPIM